MPWKTGCYRNIPTDGGARGKHTAAVKVFLVEDAPLLRERLAELIAAIPGASVVGHASGAQAAVKGILAARPDVVVLDIHLADGNGFDVMRGLRAAQFAPEIHVLTNHPLDGYRQAAERLGARGFFDKSSEFQQLRDALAAHE
jgi:DNA-binding NarL/FixJ family response regulator